MVNEERVLSGGMSIGTGLMLESIFKINGKYDKERIPPNEIDINKYKYHIYSLHTLVRNALNSFTFSKNDLNNKNLLNIVLDDIYLLSSYYDNTDCKPIISINDYEKLAKPYNKRKIYSLTKKNAFFIELNTWCLDNKKKIVTDTMVTDKIESFVNNSIGIKDRKNILLTTSFLLDASVVGIVDTIDSHTGIHRDKYGWNSRYYTIGKRDLSHLPYNRYLHYLLGDGQYVHPVDIKERVGIYDLSKHWTVVTKESKVREDIIKSTFRDSLMRYI